MVKQSEGKEEDDPDPDDDDTQDRRDTWELITDSLSPAMRARHKQPPAQKGPYIEKRPEDPKPLQSVR